MTTIQEARRSLGVAQSELAQRLGVSVASVSQTETGEARGDITLRTRARYLGALGLEDLGIVAPHTPDNTTSLPDLSPVSPASLRTALQPPAAHDAAASCSTA